MNTKTLGSWHGSCLKLSKREMAKAFRGAIKVLDTYGWKQGAMGTTSNKFCAMGAVNHLLGFNFDAKYAANFNQTPAENGLLHELNGYHDKYGSIEGAIIAYNDGLALNAQDGKKAVQKFFRKLAYGLEHGGVL